MFLKFKNGKIKVPVTYLLRGPNFDLQVLWFPVCHPMLKPRHLLYTDVDTHTSAYIFLKQKQLSNSFLRHIAITLLVFL